MKKLKADFYQLLRAMLAFFIVCVAFSVKSPYVNAAEIADGSAGNQEAVASGLTLMDCYRLALKQSETVAIQQEKIKEAEGTIIKSLSGILPGISFQYSEKRTDGSGAPLFSSKETPESKFVFSQPLFSGFKEFAAIAAGKATKRYRKDQRIRAEQLLFTDVSDAFYFYLGYQEDLLAVNGTKKALEERVAELKKREEIGRSRLSEIASAEARLSRIEAELELVLSQEAVANQLLEFLVGREINGVIDSGDTVTLPGTLEEYLVKASTRPDVLAAQENLKIFENNVTKARAGFFPSVTLDGNYYTKRDAANEGNDWDTTLKVTAPIFNGGDNIGAFQEARAQRETARLGLQETKRRAVLDAKNAYTKLDRALSRFLALEKAVKAAEKNYQLQVADYKVNLVNNLDVLQALEELQSAQRDYVAAKNETKRSFWDLLIAAGDSSYDAR